MLRHALGFLLKEYRTMDLTDRTLEDIFTALADSGGIGLIIATLIVGIALGRSACKFVL